MFLIFHNRYLDINSFMFLQCNIRFLSSEHTVPIQKKKKGKFGKMVEKQLWFSVMWIQLDLQREY
jgi:hypothetical protein